MKYFAEDDKQEVFRKQQELYAHSTEYVRGANYDQSSVENVFSNYLTFIESSCPKTGNLLDLGCGSGWSSYLLAKKGYMVVGADLNPNSFEAPIHPNLTLQEGNALSIPFADHSFDIVTSHQIIEHTPNPRNVLKEMMRVLKPGGIVVVVAPNLLSPLASMRGLVRYVWKNRPWWTIFFRSKNMPQSPFGNSIFEIIFNLIKNIFTIMWKLLAKQPSFTMRTPDLTPPFIADNDACYLCNPIDLKKHFSLQGYSIIKSGFPGRSTLTSLMATGTYISARKPKVG